MHRTHGRRPGLVPAIAAPVAAALALVAGCDTESGDGEREGEREQERGTAGEISPFTGEPVDDGGRPVLAVKIDNVAAARPQTGLAAADIVYVEPVEAGLSRLLGIYASELPDRVGPVRSAREADFELLEQFGDPALAYSGVQGRLQPVVDEAGLYPVPPGEAPDAYVRGTDRVAPHNLYIDPAGVLEAAPGAEDAGDVGFEFSGPPPAGGRPAAERSVSYQNASFSFTWSEEEGRWRVLLDGEETDAAPATVVVQRVTVRESDYRDSGGNVTPYTETVGSGTAEVLRDGRAFEAEWSRPDEGSGTEFTTPDGEPVPFAEGPVWVVFAPG